MFYGCIHNRHEPNARYSLPPQKQKFFRFAIHVCVKWVNRQIESCFFCILPRCNYRFWRTVKTSWIPSGLWAPIVIYGLVLTISKLFRARKIDRRPFVRRWGYAPTNTYHMMLHVYNNIDITDIIRIHMTVQFTTGIQCEYISTHGHSLWLGASNCPETCLFTILDIRLRTIRNASAAGRVRHRHSHNNDIQHNRPISVPWPMQ